MKIVWISHSGGIGGAEISLCEATKGLIMNGHENHVFLPTIGPLSERLVQIRATVEVSHHLLWMHTGDLHRPQYYKLRRLFKHLKSGLLISTRLKEILPDLVVTNTITTPAGAIAAKLLALPHVWYIREFGREDHGAIFDYGTRLSHFLMDKLSKRIIVNSNAVKCKYVNLLPKSKIDLVYNAVDVPLPAFNNNVEKTDSTCNLLVMGRIAPGKRQEDAILALNHLRSQGHKVTLTLVGNQDESYIHYLYSLVQMYRLEHIVNFRQMTQNPYLDFAGCDLVLVCSQQEAFGRVTIEAMKLGKPVIGTNSGGTKELIIDGQNGLLFEPGNAQELAQKVATLMTNPALRQKISHDAQIWARETFNLNRYCQDLLSVFRCALLD